MAEFYLFRSTTAKLTEHLKHIEDSGDTILSTAFLGGEKHWVIVCRKGQLIYQPGGLLPLPESRQKAAHG